MRLHCRHKLGALLLSALMIGCSDAPEPPQETKKPAAVAAKPDAMPPLNVDMISDTNKAPAATDYIIDGSASMCGYFNAQLGITENALPITKLVQAIQAVMRSDDRILIFMQDKSPDSATYLPFEQFENSLMQGRCNLNGQYTQLGLILKDYRENPELQSRSVAIVSDMHLLPAERTLFESQYDQLLRNDLTPNNPNIGLSNGILTMRSPFVGTYFTVNNEVKTLEQLQKHIHFFWLAKQKADAKQIEALQLQLKSAQGQFPNSVIAQAEFLPQVKLLTNGAKSYDSFSSPAPLISPKHLITLSDPEQKPFISSFDSGGAISDEQKYCYDLSWNAKDDIVFYPYPNPKTNRDKICPDGALFRSKTGSTLRLNLPLASGFDITPKTPAGTLEVNDGFLSIPIVDAQNACVGVSSGMPGSQKNAPAITLQYAAGSKAIDTDYYRSYAIERDGCSSESDCSNLVDKTFQYDQLIASLANRAKQQIEALYPRSITINLICDPNR